MSTTPNQPHFNGAYEGHSIPPPTKVSKSELIIGGIFVLIFVGMFCYAVIFQPDTYKFHVNDATLTQFTLSTNNNTLYYDLAFNMTLRNPDRRIGINYEIKASAKYHGMRFDRKNLGTFYLGHKEEKNLGAVFRGQQVVVLGDFDRSSYDSERNDGVYNIDLKLRLRMRNKVWSFKEKDEDRFECELKVPLSSGGSVSSARFERTKCHWYTCLHRRRYGCDDEP